MRNAFLSDIIIEKIIIFQRKGARYDDMVQDMQTEAGSAATILSEAREPAGTSGDNSEDDAVTTLEVSGMAKCGCGLIAGTDVMLYFNQQTRGGLSALSFLHREINFDNPIYDKINYSEYVKVMYSYSPCFDYIGVPAPLMAWGMENAWKNLSEQKEELTANWGGSIVKLKDIKSMLSNDIPVILSIGPNTLFFTESEHKEGIYFYTLGLSGLVRSGLMSPSDAPINDHYVTVT